MKSNSRFNPLQTQNSVSFPASRPMPECDLMDAPPESCVRVLLGIDVPARILAEIKADWALITTTQQDAPDITPAAVATALGRLQQHAVSVAGVAVIEPRENPFAAWLPLHLDASAA